MVEAADLVLAAVLGLAVVLVVLLVSKRGRSSPPLDLPKECERHLYLTCKDFLRDADSGKPVPGGTCWYYERSPKYRADETKGWWPIGLPQPGEDISNRQSMCAERFSVPDLFCVGSDWFAREFNQDAIEAAYQRGMRIVRLKAEYTFAGHYESDGTLYEYDLHRMTQTIYRMTQTKAVRARRCAGFVEGRRSSRA